MHGWCTVDTQLMHAWFTCIRSNAEHVWVQRAMSHSQPAGRRLRLGPWSSDEHCNYWRCNMWNSNPALPQFWWLCIFCQSSAILLPSLPYSMHFSTSLDPLVSTAASFCSGASTQSCIQAGSLESRSCRGIAKWDAWRNKMQKKHSGFACLIYSWGLLAKVN